MGVLLPGLNWKRANLLVIMLAVLMGDVQLTILLATRNRAPLLSRVLNGYRRAASPLVSWKMVIVNNGSSDATSIVIESFEKILPLEVLLEPVAGKNRALNRAIPAAEGRLVVVTDDDAIPGTSFLTAWSKYLDFDSDFGLFGGSVVPLFDVKPPRWLVASKFNFSMMFAERDLAEGPIDAGAIYGPNMAVSKTIFDAGFRFDERVGPNTVDSDYPTGGETEFCVRAAQSGVKCWFAKEPIVQHVVEARQLKLTSWAKRAYRTGRGRAHQMRERGEVVTPPKPSFAERLLMFSPFPEQRFKSTCAYHLWRGFQDECTRFNDGR
jgi:glucosyl-dolichyl phosphate glucuronosyltransferase